MVRRKRIQLGLREIHFTDAGVGDGAVQRRIITMLGVVDASEHFQRLVDRMHGTPEERPIAALMLRTMQKARYDEANLGHFGLATDDYTHFTSPIRRYPDLVVHRALDLLDTDPSLLGTLRRNAQRFREGMVAAGFQLTGAGHPIVPVMIGDARRAGEMAERLLAEGLYVVAFSYPVVPNGAARIRTQMSAAHTDADIDQAVAAFTRVGREMGVVS